MPSSKPRVAAYLSQDLSDRFDAFKSERGIKGDSQALIVILSEFLGVAHEVTHHVDYQLNFATKDEIEELNSKIAYLSEQIQGFDQRLNFVVSKATSELKDKLLGELPKQKEATEVSPGQLDLLEHQIEEQETGILTQSATLTRELASESISESLNADSSTQANWLTTKEAWQHLGQPCPYDTFRKYSSERLCELYGLQVDPQRKQTSKYSPKWLRLLNTVDSPQALSLTEGTENQGKPPSDSLSEP